MDVNILRLTESITITNAAGVTIAAGVSASLMQHQPGMRDPVADVRFGFTAITAVTNAWNGVAGALRVVWRGNVVYWVYAMQHYNSGTLSAVYCTPAGSPFLDPPTAAAVSGSGPHLRYTAILRQSGTLAPVASVLENTLGFAIAWQRDALGVYSGIFSTPVLADPETHRLVVLSNQTRVFSQMAWGFVTLGTPTGSVMIGISLVVSEFTGPAIELDDQLPVQILLFD